MAETGRVTRFLPVAGTHGWRGQQTGSWWQDGPWLAYMAEHGFAPYNAERPFKWSTDLDGFSLLPWKWGRSTHREWYLAGDNLYAYLVPPVHGGTRNHVSAAPHETRIVAHSHGGNCALYAASIGLRIHTLVTVCTPIRDDMREVIRLARPRIRYWLHIHSDKSDMWQILGGLCDGKVGIQRQQDAADRNVQIPRAGHTRVLEDPDWFKAWEEEGWLDVLRG